MNSLASYMAIAGAIMGSIAILFEYYNRTYFNIDMWGYTVINTILISFLIIIFCYTLQPKLKLSLPKKVYPTFIASSFFMVCAILMKIIAITKTTNISYTTTIYKTVGSIIVFIGSFYYLNEHFSYKGLIGIILGILSVFLIFS